MGVQSTQLRHLNKRNGAASEGYGVKNSGSQAHRQVKVPRVLTCTQISLPSPFLAAGLRTGRQDGSELPLGLQCELRLETTQERVLQRRETGP